MLTPFFASPKSVPSLQSQTCHLKNCSTYQKRKTVYYKKPSTVTFIRYNFQLHGLSNIRHQTENRRHASGLGIPWRVTSVNPTKQGQFWSVCQSFWCLAISGLLFKFRLGHVITLSFHVPLEADCLNNCCTNKNTFFHQKSVVYQFSFQQSQLLICMDWTDKNPRTWTHPNRYSAHGKPMGNRRGWKQIPLTLT